MPSPSPSHLHTSLFLLLWLTLLLLLPSATLSNQAPLSKSFKQCLKSSPHSLSPSQAKTLCGDGTNMDHPAKCAKAILKAAKSTHPWTTDEVVSFCKSSSTSHPHECVKSLHSKQSKLSVPAKSQLCIHSSPTSDNYSCTQSLPKLPKSYPADFPALFCGTSSPTSASTSCLSSLKLNSFTHTEALRICQSASSSTPAACANDKSIQSSLTSLQISNLCGGSGVMGEDATQETVKCVKKTPSYFKVEESVRLCSGSPTTHPASCATAVDNKLKRKLGVEGTILLCRGAQSTGPAVCASAVPGKVSNTTTIELCKGADSNAPAKCFKESAKSMRNDEDLMVSLCKGGGRGGEGDVSGGVLECLEAAPFTMGRESKARLCNGARDKVPAECAEFMWNKGIQVAKGTVEDARLNEEHVVKLCSGVSSIAPALCYFQAPNSLSKADQETLCEGETNIYTERKEGNGKGKGKETSTSVAAMCASEGLKHNLDHSLVVRLCRTHVSVDTKELIFGPISCAISAPFNFAPNQVLDLCQGATNGFPSTCAKRVDNSFTNSLKVKLCTNSEDFTPVECIDHLPSTLTQEDAVKLCAEVKTLTPAYCISSLTTSMVTNRDISKCRKAVSTATSLELKSVEYEGDALLPGTNMVISLNLVDQYGQFRNWDNDTYVSAKIAVKGSGGAVLEGKRVNVTENGVALFDTLSVDKEGNFSLGFYVGQTVGEVEVKEEKEDEQFSDKAAAASLRLRVGMDPTEARMAGICHGLFDSFMCSAEDDEPVRVDNMEAISLIPFPSSTKFMPCVDLLEEAGFTVTQSWIGDLWLRSSSGVEILGLGLITKDMGHWERLGLEVGASKSMIKKAYFKKSLEWHPDRWVQHPHLRSKAANIFELISEAYRGLTGCLKMEGEDGGNC